MKREHFLLEVGVEELPHGYVNKAREALRFAFEKKLKELKLNYDSLKTHSTPRRLVVFIQNLEKEQKDNQIIKKGPLISVAFKDGEITAVGEGFLRSAHLEKYPKLKEIPKGKPPEGLFQQEENGKVFLYHTTIKKGQSTNALLKKSIPEILTSLPFPKSMRWANLDVLFYRPLRWLVCLLGEEIIPFELAGVVANNKSFGHRQLSPKDGFEVTIENHNKILESNGVILDQDKRKEKILSQLKKIELETNCFVTPEFKNKLLSKVSNLVEFPHLVCCRFDETFLKIPHEVLISEMVEHQMYFPLHQKDDTLSNQFIVTANIDSSDNVKKGNEKVLTSRLRDGKFLYEQDLEMGLNAMGEKLDKITYQKDLGSYTEKVERTKLLARYICKQQHLNSSMEESVLISISLCKNDLASNMVYEFPNLQGTMGGYYAKAEGVSLEESQSIPEHHRPISPTGELPSTKLSSVVALADKFETILGCFSIGITPTGSQDPYGLRRMAFGIIRIVIENKMFFSLKTLLDEKVDIYQHFIKNIGGFKSKKEYHQTIIYFFTNRVKSHFKECGFPSDVVESSIIGEVNDIYSSYIKAETLTQFKKKSFLRELTQTVKRIKHILKKEEISGEPSTELFKKREEENLYQFHQKIKDIFYSHLKNKEFTEAMCFLEQKKFAQVLADFFDNVLVNVKDENLRLNRLRLLNLVDRLIGNVFDFEKLII